MAQLYGEPNTHKVVKGGMVQLAGRVEGMPDNITQKMRFLLLIHFIMI